MSDSDNENSIFGISEDLVPAAAIKSAGVSEIDFDGLLSPPLKLHEDLKNGCGGQLWPAGMVLSKYMLRKHRDHLAGKDMQVAEKIVWILANAGAVLNLVLAVDLLGRSFDTVTFFTLLFSFSYFDTFFHSSLTRT
jgi:hypothetical protein